MISEYTINWSSLNNLTPPDLNLTNVTVSDLMDRVPETANTVTNNYYGIVVLLLMGMFIYWLLTDKTQFGYFKYSEIRGLGIALGIISIFGIVMLSIGYITNIMHVSTIFTLYLIALGYTIIENPS